MGKLSDAKNKVKEEQKDVQEQLDILISLAKSQTEIFQQRIEASLKDGKISDDLTVPITKVLAKQLESRAVYKEGSGDIVTKVTDAFKQLFNGNGQIADAVGSIISTGIDAILGAGEGTEKIVETYYVVVEYPALVRYDISCWGRNMKATGYLTSILTSAISYTAYKSAMRAAKEHGSLVPPKHVLNAPTKLMKGEGYGDGYRYDHDEPDAFSGQGYFPEKMGRRTFYDPPERGFERELRKRLEWWAKLRRERN